jgi:hypothetical protein
VYWNALESTEMNAQVSDKQIELSLHIQAFWPLNYHTDFSDFEPASILGGRMLVPVGLIWTTDLRRMRARLFR